MCDRIASFFVIKWQSECDSYFSMVYKITTPINYRDSRVINVTEQLPSFFIKNDPISDFSHRKWELNSHPFYGGVQKKAISCTQQIKFSRQQESIAWLLYHGGWGSTFAVCQSRLLTTFRITSSVTNAVRWLWQMTNPTPCPNFNQFLSKRILLFPQIQFLLVPQKVPENYLGYWVFSFLQMSWSKHRVPLYCLGTNGLSFHSIEKILGT